MTIETFKQPISQEQFASQIAKPAIAMFIMIESYVLILRSFHDTRVNFLPYGDILAGETPLEALHRILGKEYKIPLSNFEGYAFLGYEKSPPGFATSIRDITGRQIFVFRVNYRSQELINSYQLGQQYHCIWMLCSDANYFFANQTQLPYSLYKYLQQI